MKKNNLLKSKIIAVLLMAMMIASMAPVGLNAYAADENGAAVVNDAELEGGDNALAPETAQVAAPAANAIGDRDLVTDGEDTDTTTEVQAPQPAVSQQEAPQPAAPVVTFRAGYESVSMSWKAVSSNYGKDKKVYYEIRNGSDTPVKTGLTTTSYKAAFDPYPGNKSGKGSSGKAKKATFSVYSYIIDPANNQKKYSVATTRKNIEVIHPMYVVVKIKKNTKIYKTGSSNKSVGKAKKGTKYIVVGGSRIKGENKRVVVKINGQYRYIKSSHVKIEKMVYSAKKGSSELKPPKGTAFNRADVEYFINEMVQNPKTGKYVKLPQVKAKWRKNNNYLIWVNTYHQRVYLFKWKGGKWTIDSRYPNGILCNTGKELTPMGIFKVSNKWAKKPTTGTKWWCIFNSVGIHSKLGDKLGQPTSGGCVRIPKPIAKKFYSSLIKVGTTVYVY